MQHSHDSLFLKDTIQIKRWLYCILTCALCRLPGTWGKSHRWDPGTLGRCIYTFHNCRCPVHYRSAHYWPHRVACSEDSHMHCLCSLHHTHTLCICTGHDLLQKEMKKILSKTYFQGNHGKFMTHSCLHGETK